MRRSLCASSLIGALALLGACSRPAPAPAASPAPAGGEATVNVEASLATCSDIGGDSAQRLAACTAAIGSNAASDVRAKALNNRGVLLGFQGDNDRAIADYDAAIGLDPKYAAAFYNRAHAWRAKGDAAKADADAAQAVQLDPNLKGR